MPRIAVGLHALALLLALGIVTTSAASIGSRSVNVSFDELERAGLGKRAEPALGKRSLGKAWSGTSTLSAAGTTGVSAMQVSVVDDDHVVIYDKAENNPLQINGHPAWGSVYTISTQAVRPLNMQTNSFCAGGGWTSDGTLVSFGGQQDDGGTNYVGDGFMSIRTFVPCDDDTCDVVDDITANSLTSKRWYPSSARLGDGSLIIVGGSTAQSFTGGRDIENPTLEFYPRKGDGVQIFSQFISDANPTNLFPIMFYLPNGLLFVAANKLAMLYDWKTNKETRLPSMPNGVRVNYPATAAAVLLPLTIANNWTPEILICGGTTADVDGPPEKLSALTPASTQCVRMVLNAAGIAGGWQVEQMETPRIMGEALLTPDGKVLIVNGAMSGVAGYSDADPATRIGEGNARNPNYKATLYDPLAAKGSRFSSNFPASKIERMYHSSATLLPDGRFMITGSNPNPSTDTEAAYPSRWDVEILTPPYALLDRPVISGDSLPIQLSYGQTVTVAVAFPVGTDTKLLTAVILDLGYSTHAVHMNHRSVELVCKFSADGTGVDITGPANTGIYPPGYAWIYILADGVPSQGTRLMIGSGGTPPIAA